MKINILKKCSFYFKDIQEICYFKEGEIVEVGSINALRLIETGYAEEAKRKNKAKNKVGAEVENKAVRIDETK